MRIGRFDGLQDTGPRHRQHVDRPGDPVGTAHTHQHDTAAPDEKFSEFRAGLDHVAFGCASRAELESWAARLDQLGVANGGVVDAHYGSGLSFRDPDGIALEFFAPPG